MPKEMLIQYGFLEIIHEEDEQNSHDLVIQEKATPMKYSNQEFLHKTKTNTNSPTNLLDSGKNISK